jgi:integrase
MIHEGWLSGENPFSTATRSQKKARIRNAIPDDTIRALLAACDRLPVNAFKKCRARAVLNVLAYGALRRSELRALTLADVDFKEGRLHIRNGKGGKSRYVYPCAKCMEAIRAYMALRPAYPFDSLFVSDRSTALSESAIYKLLTAVKTVAGLPDLAITPHNFRHSAATRAAERGVPLSVVSSMLGHSQLATTARYIHPNEHMQAQYRETASLDQPGAGDKDPKSKTKKAKQAEAEGKSRRRITAKPAIVPAAAPSQRFKREDLRRPVKSRRRRV